MIRRAALALAGALLALAPPPAGAELPIFDAHIHYSRPDWDAFTPERAGGLELKGKATNRIGQSQPPEPLWNPSGYMRNVVETMKVSAA